MRALKRVPATQRVFRSRGWYVCRIERGLYAAFWSGAKTGVDGPMFVRSRPCDVWRALRVAVLGGRA